MERTLTRWLDIPDLRKLDVYARQRRIQGAAQGAVDMKPEEIINEVKNSNLRGRGGASVSDGREVELHPPKIQETGLPVLQRRRE